MYKSEFLSLINHQVFNFSPRLGCFSPVDVKPFSSKGESFLFFFPKNGNYELEFNFSAIPYTLQH